MPIKLEECRIAFLSRKKLPQNNSLEELFEAVGNEMKKKGFNISYLEMPHSGANLKSIYYNIKKASSSTYDINHITGDINYIVLATNKSTVLTVHDVDSILQGHILKKFLKVVFWFWIPAVLLNRVTVISNFSKNQLIKIIPFAKKKIKVVHNPVNPNLQKHPKSFNNVCPRILHIGTKSNKNLERTIKALHDIECILVIIGKLTQEQKTLLMEYSINYENEYFIPYNAIIDHYKKCDLVSFISTYEGFGMPIVEAQAIGRPVITSNVASMPEVAGNGAYMVNPFDIIEINRGIKLIIDDPSLRDNLVAHGYSNVKRFEMSKIVNRYLDIYKEIKNEN